MEKGPTRIELQHLNGQPLFRIGLFQGQEHMDLKIMGEFSVYDGAGNRLLSKVNSDLKWRVKIKESKPGKESFFLVLYESFNLKKTEAKLALAQKLDPGAKIRTMGGEIFLDSRKVNDNTKYCVVCGNYSSEIAARKAFKKFQPDFIPYFEKQNDKESHGIMEAFDAEYDHSTEATDVLRIVPKKPETLLKVFGVRSYNDILQRENFNDLVFNGSIEFRFDVSGKLMAISEVPLEIYLKRVIYSEIGTGLPLELFKSLAIVCRSEAMARIDHRRLGDPYHYGDNGETLRYFGDEYTDDKIDQAVDETSGQVIISDNFIRDSHFHLICGGHTEDAMGLFDTDEETFYNGKVDSAKKPKDLNDLGNEESANKWINSRPDTWCNLRGRDLPPALERVKKYFRWEVNYSRRELEDIIRKKTGEDIGIIFELIPHQRGRSGRLLEIELIGSLKNYRIRGQLSIREALSHDYLPSSCFLVERELDETGTPISFTFVGAGQGHGMGMCKTGAAVMAMDKADAKKILKHYFSECRIASIYDQ